MSDYRKQVLVILLRALGVLFGLALIIVLTAGCSAYSAYPTSTPTAGTPAATLTPVTGLIEVTGNVYVRDSNNEVQGWLEAGTLVQAECREDNWCYVKAGQFKGLKFWRGCSEDNPEDIGCVAR